MCCTLAKARLSNTILYAGKSAGFDDQVTHMLGYQNTVQNLSVIKNDRASLDWDYPNPSWESKGSGNAMILPIPAIPGSMGRGNIVSTEKCPNILKDMERALRPNPNTLSAGPRLRGDAPKKVEIFDSGIYTVVLASKAGLIPGVLSQVPEEKRPVINYAIFAAYEKWYPDWTVALCCFNNKDAKAATPMLWRYCPIYPELLFLPALDAHTGEAPDLNAVVDVDHTVIVSSHQIIGGDLVKYSDANLADFKYILPSRIIGGRFNGKLRNGDFVCHLNDVENGKFAPKRLLPPGVPRRLA